MKFSIVVEHDKTLVGMDPESDHDRNVLLVLKQLPNAQRHTSSSMHMPIEWQELILEFPAVSLPLHRF